MSVFFIATGLTSATLCQKSSKKIVDEVAQWNSQVNGQNPLQIEIAINHYSKKATKGANFRVLLLIEPSITWPKNSSKNFSHYDMVVAAGSFSNMVTPYPWFNRPDANASQTRGSSERKKRFTAIAADKYSWVPGELYSLRRRIARKFPDFVDLYGPGWNKGFLRRLKTTLGELAIILWSGRLPKLSGFISYLFLRVSSSGTIETKQEAYERNVFALVVENSLELRTEKLYDAVESGAIPVYVGPEVQDDIPADLYVLAEPTEAGIILAMRKALDMDVESWKASRKSWMASRSYLDSESERFRQMLLEISKKFE
jgi:hypothetical protein